MICTTHICKNCGEAIQGPILNRCASGTQGGPGGAGGSGSESMESLAEVLRDELMRNDAGYTINIERLARALKARDERTRRESETSRTGGHGR